ncbi:hypothetical protein EVAR_59552_1 [Eumeta japonica]|uniref:Uncharacterized protein n=1 Tax=Eumeta variegata TaxID=151549 RepID=A0A4C1ZR31_EUMVA|nr:hypothetical protein EVAR_59552_1 [Eumeta japonica]
MKRDINNITKEEVVDTAFGSCKSAVDTSTSASALSAALSVFENRQLRGCRKLARIVNCTSPSPQWAEPPPQPPQPAPVTLHSYLKYDTVI